MDETEKETLDGSSIKTRALTIEEKEREITLERFEEWMNEVGEDFVDQHEYGSGEIFCGFLLHKYQDRAENILEIRNESFRGGSHVSIQEFQGEFYYDTDKMNDWQ